MNEITTADAIAWFERRKDGIAMSGAMAMYDKAISALRAQAEAEKNEPLTLDELREMDGEPVWGTLGIGWKICYGLTDHRGYLYMETGDGDFICMDHYGEKWLVYRRKKEEGETNE